MARQRLVRACLALLAAGIAVLLVAACGSETPSDPRELLLSPADIPGMGLKVVAESEEQSVEGPSALVELQGRDFRVLQTVVLFETRELALSALDGIRSDLVNRGEAGPGGVETSGILEHTLGPDEASSQFLIEDRALLRLTVTGPDRLQLLEQLAEATRNKLTDG